MLKQIKNTIQSFLTQKNKDIPYCYGLMTKDIQDWNYIVYKRVNAKFMNKKDLTSYYQIGVVMEDFIDEQFVIDLITELSKISGLSLTDDGVSYDYVRKANTDVVVEVASFVMKKPRKNVI